MGTGKHRAVGPRRQRMGFMVAAGAVPLVLSLVGNGTACAEPYHPEPYRYLPVNRTEHHHIAPIAEETIPSDETLHSDGSAHQDRTIRWPDAEAPNVRPYRGMRIPDDTLSSLQWARPLPKTAYLSPVENLHLPGPVEPVPPIAPPPGVLRFGDVQVDAPEWLPREQAIQINDGAAVAEANLATFLDSVGMERTRSDRVAGQTIGAAAIGAAVGGATALPFTAIGAGFGGALGLAIGLPFAPIGLAAAPVGAAYGAALMAVPLTAIGAGIGAGLGAAHALSAPPKALGPEEAPTIEES
ncbi:hypothetical protein [Nocardia paucivorans]|uniref:hypothetical protein n=1 Tax=Nocardia paucivorans TaxID=114259 RepID=UPI0002F96F13|nr:hypothetical protein [Nocardia paucivorans]